MARQAALTDAGFQARLAAAMLRKQCGQWGGLGQVFARVAAAGFDQLGEELDAKLREDDDDDDR